uniref:(northern house mosquito) hypothetical protein n=1 Tax=Culex pipiens TaxID=7175 RepID=A0A8D8MNK2_CULPI
MVPLASGLRLLVVRRGHQHAAVVRGPVRACRGRRRRSDPVRQGQGRNRRVPTDQPEHAGAGPGTAPDHLESGSPPEALRSGADPRPQPPLLLDQHQLPEERTRAEDAAESAQKVLDGWTYVGQLPGALQHQREHHQRNARAGQELQQGPGGRGKDDAGAACDQERGQAGPEAASGGEGGHPDVEQHRAVPRCDAGHDRVQVGPGIGPTGLTCLIIITRYL